MSKLNQFVGTIACAFVLTLAACNKEETANNPETQSVALSSTELTEMMSEKGTNLDDVELSASARASRRNQGYLYIESNEAGTNHILIYKQSSDGSLSLDGTTASGGTGTGALFGSQGAISIDAQHEWLYAVNAGNNTISSFKIKNNGSLTLDQTVASGGTRPVSVCVYKDLVYVVNQTSANIQGYRIGSGHNLTAIASSNKALSAPTADPGQISFHPNGHLLYITERGTDKITSFQINRQGVADTRKVNASAGLTPFGFDFARNYMIVANAHMDLPNLGGAASYSLSNSGSIRTVNGNIANNRTAACWTKTTRNGRFAYIANSFSDDISSYYIGPNGAAYLINQSAAPTGRRSRDISLIDNTYLYVLNVTDHTISEYRRGFAGTLQPIGQVTNIPVWAAGLASY